MSANLPLLVVAVVLLWLPRGWMRRGFALWRARGRSRAGDANVTSVNKEELSFGREFTKARNYYDFFRALIAALVLIGGSGPLSDLRPVISSGTESVGPTFVFQAAVLLIGVLLQTMRYERDRWSLTAPVFYSAGISLILFTPWPGLCGFVMAWLLCTIKPNAQAFLIVQAFVAAVVAFGLYGMSLFSLLGCGLGLLPVVLALLMNKPLIVFSRRGLSTTRGVNP